MARSRARSKTKKTTTATPIAAALADGDGLRFLKLIATKPPDRLKAIGAKIDQSRWSPMPGRALVLAGDWLLGVPDIEAVHDFLPALAIATVRQRHQKSAAKRAWADRVYEKLPAVLARSEWGMDLVARSGCHYFEGLDQPEHAKDMLALVRDCPGIEQNAYYQKLVKLVGSTKSPQSTK